MKTLLIWENFEDAAHIYWIDDAPDWLIKCHGRYYGEECDADVDACLLRVSDALSPEKELCDNPDDELACRWHSKRHGKTDVPVFGVEMGEMFQVVVCGVVP